MTSAERANLHVLLLQFLRSKLEIGLTEDGLKNLLRMQALDVTQPQLQAELRMLADKAWVSPWEVELALKRWRITALGESKLTEAGL